MVVKSVVFPGMEDAFDGTESVCVGYERKGQSTVITADRPVTFDQSDELSAFFKEKSKIGATLYKDNKTGLFQVIEFLAFAITSHNGIITCVALFGCRKNLVN